MMKKVAAVFALGIGLVDADGRKTAGEGESDLFIPAFAPYGDIAESFAAGCPAATLDLTGTGGRTIQIEVPYTALAKHTGDVETSALDNSKITIPCPHNSGSLHPDRMYDTGQTYFELECLNTETAWDVTAATAAYIAACEDVNTDPNFNSYNSMYQLQGRQAVGTDMAEAGSRDGTMMRCARDVAAAVGTQAFDVSVGLTNAANVWDTRCDSGNPMKTGADATGTACVLNAANDACDVESGECRYTHRSVMNDDAMDGWENDVVDLLWNPEGLTAATEFGSGGNAPPLQGSRTGYKPGARLHRQAATMAVKFPCEKAMCTGQDDGASAACALAADFGGCAVVGGSCAYVPEWTLTPMSHDGLGQIGGGTDACDTDGAEDATAAGVACDQKGGCHDGDDSCSFTLADGATACNDGLISTAGTACIYDAPSYSGDSVTELKSNSRQANQWRFTIAPTDGS